MVDEGDFQADQLPESSVTIVAAHDENGKIAWQGQGSYPGTDAVKQTAFDATSSRFAMSLKSGTVKILRRDGDPIELDHFGVDWAGFDQTGEVVYTVDTDKTQLWSVADGRPISLRLPVGAQRGRISVRRDPERWLAVAIDSRSITLWSALIGAAGVSKDNVLSQSVPDPRTKLALDGKRRLEEAERGTWAAIDTGAAAGAIPRLKFPLSEEARLINERQNEEFTKDSIYRTEDAAISSDGTTVVTIAAERPPAVWKVGERAPRRILGEAGVERIAEKVYVDRSGNCAVIVYADPPLSYAVFDLNAGHQLAEGSRDPKESIDDISHDCKRIAFRIGSTVTVRDAIDRRVIGAPFNEAGPVCAAVFSKDDRSLAVVTADHLYLRDVETGLALADPLSFDNRQQGNRRCDVRFWFSDQDRRVNIEPETTATSEVNRQSWKVRVELIPEQRSQVAAFASLYYGVRLSPRSALEELPRRPVAELRERLADIGSPELREAIGRLLSFPRSFDRR
jgi:hypothetical protein